jgi:xanthine dehydrogenase accessory factor
VGAVTAAVHSAHTALAWLASDARVACGLLVEVEGSAPLKAGATMFVDDAARVEGSITGGCVESAVAQEALTLMERGGSGVLLRYGISDAVAGTAGLMCGGVAHVFVSELAGTRREAMVAALEALVQRRPCAIATVLDGPAAGARMMVDADRAVGTLEGPELLDRNVEREARGLITAGRSLVRNYGTDGATLGEGRAVHIAAHALAPQLVVFGAIDFSAAIAPLARGLGYAVTICDPRSAFLDSPRFSAAAQTLRAWPQEALRDRALGPRDAVLVFSHDARLDVPALQAALATEAGYIGALGSRRTTADRERRLREGGATDAQLERIFAPCGLDIGSSTPEETALAILAEIVAHRAGRDGHPLRGGVGPIRSERGPAGASDI